MRPRQSVHLIDSQAAGRGGFVPLPHTYTVIDDFGKAILGEREEALGRAWHVPYPPSRTQDELMGPFFREIGRQPRLSGRGRGMMGMGGLFIPAARESVERMYEFEKPFVVDSSRFVRAFGDIATPNEQAIRATVAW